MSERAAPFYCPYCGEEDIRPDGEQHGQWRCGACLRVWALRYVGLGRRDATDPHSPRSSNSPDSPGPTGQRGSTAAGAAVADLEVTR